MQLDLFPPELIASTKQGSGGKRGEKRRPAQTGLIVFPLSRRQDLIRTAVAELVCRDHHRGRAWWTTHVRRLRQELSALGMSRVAIKAHINTYTEAVRSALATPGREGSG